jgi:chromosome segregation ATPase
MLELHAAIDELQLKMQELLNAHKQLRKENERLQKELRQTLQQEATLQEQLQQLDQKLAAARISNSNWTVLEKQALQKKIDNYLKEIDKCMALLHA